jgi:hypothetical protein
MHPSRTDGLIKNEKHLSKKHLIDLAATSKSSGLKKSRICVHSSVADALHEMFIYHAQDAYVRPHKHLKKGESFFLIEGQVDAIFFDDHGRINNVLRMDSTNNSAMYYRLNDPVYHSLLIKSDHILFYEATLGPFIKQDTQFAPWSPGEDDIEGIACFKKELEQKVEAFLAKKKEVIE